MGNANLWPREAFNSLLLRERSLISKLLSQLEGEGWKGGLMRAFAS